ncbi:MAG: putative DNA binding domain-containing protein [Desulfobacterales bacterium]|nr:putative DNA binding domain-containing protein [Desulfobacterales bacterium]
MTLQEIKALVSGGESERIEFKATTGQRTSAAKTVCAMLNGMGGYVLFGVRDDGKIVGQEVTERTLRDITGELQRLDPPAFPEIETVPLKSGKEIIVLTIPGGKGIFTYDGRAYMRHGPTTKPMPKTEYERRLVERLHATRRWENEPVPDGVSIADLDEEEIHLTIENAVRLGRLESPPRSDIQSILRGLELIHDGRLLNAAVALYGKTSRLKPIYPQLVLRLARFRGRNRLADFSDNREYWGHAFSLLRRAESFLLDHVPIAGRVVPGKMVREDQPSYPPRATREALANALCHRDYAVFGGAVTVAMYDDHLEVANPGGFHFGMTPEKLTKTHESKPWNPIIAGVFYRAGIIEKWGTGTLNILDWCADNGNPAPAWAEEAGSVVLSFTPAVTDQVAGEDTAEDTAEVAEEVAEKIMRLLSIMDGAMTRQDIQRALGLKHEEHIRRAYLVPALKTGAVQMTIPDKPRSKYQKYRLTDKGIRLLRQMKESLK